MSEWKEYKLGEIVHIIGGGTPKTSEPKYWNGNIPWLSVVDFNNGNKYVNDTEKHITQEGLENSSTRLLKKGDIIISARGTVGAIAMLVKEMAFNQSCYGVRNSELIDNHYLFYLLKNSINELKQNSHGGVFDTITRETFNSIDISLPSLSEQKRIVSILSSLDDKIDLLHRENKTLEAMAETLFRQWFIEEAKEDDMCLLGEVIKTTSGGTPSRKNEEYYCNGNIEWVKSKELHHSYILDTEEKITEDAITNSSAKLLPENSVLIAMYGATVGEYGIISKPMTCNQAICALIPNENYPYTYLYLWVKYMQGEFINLACGAAQQNISQELIKQQYVSNDLKQISDFHILVAPYLEKMKVNQEMIQTLIQTRDSLLPKLMSGEIKV
ncbi:MAG: restriction endonuclease subunit S [Bacteroidales bacterium]|nr:restriction endonuclease subunit S [Bacteroidales bacterium]